MLNHIKKLTPDDFVVLILLIVSIPINVWSVAFISFTPAILWLFALQILCAIIFIRKICIISGNDRKIEILSKMKKWVSKFLIFSFFMTFLWIIYCLMFRPDGLFWDNLEDLLAMPIVLLVQLPFTYFLTSHNNICSKILNKFNAFINFCFTMFKLCLIAFPLCFMLALLMLALKMLEIGYSYDKSKPTEFFKIDEWHSSEGVTQKLEYFVLSNPPNDSASLRKIVEEYNFRTMSVDTIKKYEINKRSFYRDDGCLNRNYEEGKPYIEGCGYREYNSEENGQSLKNHEWLIETYYRYFHANSTDYIYYFSEYFGRSERRKIEIESIDEFFEEGRKKLNLDSTKLLY